MPDSHALLSPSSSERWLICTPCAVLESKLPEQKRADSAAEGTLAHSFAELCLNCFKNYFNSDKIDYPDIKYKISKSTEFVALSQNALWGRHIHQLVWDEYVVPIWKQAYNAKELWIEEKLELWPFREIELPYTYGTTDCIFIIGDVLHIYDLKFGKWVVGVENNTQLYLYASMALIKAANLNIPINEVCINVIQPRVDNVHTSITLKTEQLMCWLRGISTNAMKASKGEGELVYGDHCKWCRLMGTCTAMQDQAMSLVTKNYHSEDIAVKDAKALEIFKMLPVIENFIKQLKEYMNDRANEGKEFEGYELRSHRNLYGWGNKDAVINALHLAQYEDKDIMTLKTPAKIKELIGPTVFNRIVNEHVIATPCRATLAPIKYTNKSTKLFKELNDEKKE